MRLLAVLVAAAVVIEAVKTLALAVVALAVLAIVGYVVVRLTDNYVDISRVRRAPKRAGGIGGRRRLHP